MLPLFWRGLRRDLDKRDLGAPLSQDMSAQLADRLEKNWFQEISNCKMKKRKPSLLRAIVRTFIMQYLLDGLLVLIQYVCCKSFQPLLLAQLLGHLANSSLWSTTGRPAALQCAAGMVMLSLAGVFIQHHTTLRQQRLGMRIRIACCSLLYRKILRMSSQALGQTTAGQLVNLMSNDVNRFDSVLKFLHVIWVVPIQIALCCYLYSQRVSTVALLGVAFIILQTLPVQSYISRISSRLRLKIAKKTDERVRLMDEIICGIQVIKMYAWEGPFSSSLTAARQAEMHYLKHASRLRAVNASFLIFAERTSLYVTLLGHVLLGRPVDAATVYSLAQLYNMLQTMLAYVYPNALTASAECLVSVRRIQSLLLLEERDPPAITNLTACSPGIDNFTFDPMEEKIPRPLWTRPVVSAPLEPAIELKGVAAAWQGPPSSDTLAGLEMKLHKGKLCVIIGSVGAGKSSLLQLLLKELPCRIGSMTVRGSISYASQEPWLFVATIRNNILFGQPYEPKKYREVVRVCALEKDFTQFPRGDQTLVGERGISLSGGQRARINLARAVYRETDIYLLDDPLAGVDAPVSNQLFHACITDYLHNKTRILVTHQQQYLKAADIIVVMENGRIISSGSYDELARCGADPAELMSEPPLDRGLHSEHEHPFTPTASIREIARRISVASTVKSEYDDEEQAAQEEEGEMTVSGRMKASVFGRYWKAGRCAWLLYLVAAVMLLSQLSASGADYWVTYWTNHRSQEIIQMRQLEELYLTATDGNSLETTYGILNYELDPDIDIEGDSQAEYLKNDKPHKKYPKNLADLLILGLHKSNITLLDSNKTDFSSLAEVFNKKFLNTNLTDHSLDQYHVKLAELLIHILQKSNRSLRNGTAISTTEAYNQTNDATTEITITSESYNQTIVISTVEPTSKRNETGEDSTTQKPISTNESIDGITPIEPVVDHSEFHSNDYISMSKHEPIATTESSLNESKGGIATGKTITIINGTYDQRVKEQPNSTTKTILNKTKNIITTIESITTTGIFNKTKKIITTSKEQPISTSELMQNQTEESSGTVKPHLHLDKHHPKAKRSEEPVTSNLTEILERFKGGFDFDEKHKGLFGLHNHTNKNQSKSTIHEDLADLLRKSMEGNKINESILPFEIMANNATNKKHADLADLLEKTTHKENDVDANNKTTLFDKTANKTTHYKPKTLADLLVLSMKQDLNGTNKFNRSLLQFGGSGDNETDTKTNDLLDDLSQVLGSLTTIQYLYVHTALITMCIILTISGSVLFFTACMKSSYGLHNEVFTNVLFTNMRFFDTNPSGRILNRFSKDMGSIDELLPKDMMEALQILLFTVSALFMVSLTSCWLLLPAGLLLLLFWGLLSCYLATAQDIKRLEGITRSPVFSHTCASIKGISTIRSSNAQNQLAKEFDLHQDLHTAAWYQFLSSRSTLGFWLDIICVSFVACVSFTFILFNDGSTLPGDAGLAISQSLILTSMLQFGVRQATEVVSHLTSVERVLQYTELPMEKGLHKGEKPTPKNWPSGGSITFKHVFLSYSDVDRPVLQDLSIHIKSGWKVGIVGRTGAGKSSLIAALFRLATVEGSITIDGVEMSSISLQDLRSRISIIPQEPILFSASMRHNLDPFEEYDDATLWSALESVDLKDSVKSLEQKVSEGGGNFSLGQRQLVCLARAILRNNKILVLDEATANMDPQTDQFIQRIIATRFASCTVITIAHRLAAVLTADRVLVLEGGRLAQFGRPKVLLRDTKGPFARLAQGLEHPPGTPSYGSMSDEADS